MVMRDPANRVQMLSTLRFALNVMEERSHIGLDEKAVGTLRSALLRRIVETETALRLAPAADATENRTAEELFTV